MEVVVARAKTYTLVGIIHRAQAVRTRTVHAQVAVMDTTQVLPVHNRACIVHAYGLASCHKLTLVNIRVTGECNGRHDCEIGCDAVYRAKGGSVRLELLAQTAIQ